MRCTFQLTYPRVASVPNCILFSDAREVCRLKHCDEMWTQPPPSCSASKVSSESWQRKRFPASGQLAQLATLRLVDADDGRSGSRFQGPNIYLEGVG